MKMIKLSEAYKILENCAAVIFDLGGGACVSYPRLDDLAEGDNDNVFLELEQDVDGKVRQSEFTEGDNLTVEVVGSSMFLKDTRGENIQVSVLLPAQL